MRAGKLRRKVQIQQQSEAHMAGGQPSQEWTTWATVPAQIETQKASELRAEAFRAQQFNPETIYIVQIRYLAGVTALHRMVVDDGRVFDILSVEYGERKSDPVQILCRQRVAWDSGN